jgi:hypothetical protein
MKPLTKHDLLNSLKPYLVAEDDGIAELTRSTGTSGLQSIKIRSRYELALIDESFSAAEQERESEIVLLFSNTHHGNRAQFGSTLYIPVDVSNKVSVESGISLLCKEFDFPRTASRIRTITGSVNNITQFTAYLQHKGISKEIFDIKQVVCSGSHLSSRTQESLADYWGVRPKNIYSISEICGAASICEKCGTLNFTSNVVPFAINLTDDDPLERGYGRLCVTELLPFGLCQPLIKYFTGDVVEVVKDACCEAHRGGIRRVGRLSDCLFHPRDSARMLLTAQDLYEAVDIPGVNREEVWLNYVDEMPTKFFGQPLARVFAEEAGLLEIIVELNTVEADEQTVCQQVYKNLLNSVEAIRDAIALGELDLVIRRNPQLTAGLKK